MPRLRDLPPCLALTLLMAACTAPHPAAHRRPAGTALSPRNSPASLTLHRSPLWLQSLKMITPRVGWALRSTENPGLPDAAVLAPARTTDGGHNWVNVTPPAASRLLKPAGTPGVLYAMDADHAWWAVPGPGPASTVFGTANGGRSWFAGRLPSRHGVPAWLQFIDAQHGWLLQDLGAAMGSDAIAVFRTVDGGRHWRLLARTGSLVGGHAARGGLSTGCDKTGVGMVNLTIGWITLACNGLGAPVYLTHDGGSTWATKSLPIPAAACATGGCETFPPQFFGSVGFLTVHSPLAGDYLLVTADAGADWEQVALPTRNAAQIQFVDARHGFLVLGTPAMPGGARFYVTADTGRTWTYVRPSVRFGWLGLRFLFVNPLSGFAWTEAGDSGVVAIYRTADGGRTWVKFTPSVTG